MKEYNVNDSEQLKRIGYLSLLGEREAESAAERMGLNVLDRRRNYPDYERGAVTNQTNNSGAKSVGLMGQSIPEAVSGRAAAEDIRKGLAGDGKSKSQNVQFADRLDVQRGLLGTDRITEAGDKPAFSMSLESRVSGDALLDAQGTMDPVKGIGGQVDDGEIENSESNGILPCGFSKSVI